MALGRRKRECRIAESLGLRPGQPAPRTGEYLQVGPEGERGRTVTAFQGQPLPATPRKGMRYFLLEPHSAKAPLPQPTVEA